MAVYTAVAVARTPNQSAPPTLVEMGPLSGSIAYTDILNDTGEASVSVSVNALAEDIKARLRDLLVAPLEVVIYRDSTAVFRGPVVGGGVANEVLTLDVRSLDYYLDYMARYTDYTASSVDQYAIVKALVDTYQALDYGDFGIDTSGIGSSGVTRNYAIVAEEPKILGDVLRELSGIDNGFDYHVDHETRDLVLETLKGSDKSASVFLERGVTSSEARFTVAAGHIASDIQSVGTGPDIQTPLLDSAADASVRSAFGRVTIPKSMDNVTDATNLADATQAFLDERGSVFFIPGPSLTPVAGAGVEDFDTGDLVTYSFDAGLGLVTGTYRITKKQVSVSDSGQETISVEFA